MSLIKVSHHFVYHSLMKGNMPFLHLLETQAGHTEKKLLCYSETSQKGVLQV